VIADPYAVAKRTPDALDRELAHLALTVTITPWSLSAADRERARAAGLDESGILQAITLASYFGHLNRIADAVGIDLDYRVSATPPHAEATTPSYERPDPELWPDPDEDTPIELELRSGLAEALARWRDHVLERDTELGRPRRHRIARAVAERLGDAATLRELADPGPGDALDQALLAMADQVTLAPWALGAGTVDALRSAGLAEDERIFAALVTATSCTVFSRLEVARRALARPQPTP
jgi:alkylhydroperoxidase family enzyme